MAYSTFNAPRLISGSPYNDAPNLWVYSSADAPTAVRVSGYITNARNLGMKRGDLVFAVKTDDRPISCQIHIVSAVNADGSADLSDGLAITATNSD